MKRFLLTFMLVPLWQALLAQCAVPVITVSGRTSFCSGGSVTLSAPTSSAWTQKADFGGIARSWATGFSIGNKGYIGTGIATGNSYKKDFWEYDPATGAWTQKADFGGTARVYATGFSIGSKGYIGTGHDGSSYKKDFWEYDPARNAWIQKADFGGSARQGATGFSIGSKGYIGTGLGGGFKKDFWEYNPTSNAWTQKADFGGVARSSATGFSMGSKGYIGVGADDIRRNKDFWEYNPTNNAWTQKADFGGTARYAATGFSIGSKGYIGTGYDGSYRKDFWEYNPTSNAWTQKADFGGTVRYAATGFSIGSKGYIGTGSDGTIYKKDFWESDPGYSYAWQPGGQTTAYITVSTAGNYTVTTTNALGCSAASVATVVTVIAPPGTPAISVIQPTCSTPAGTITVNSTIGAGITYSINGINYQASNIFNNVAPGSYNVTAKNSSGCVSSSVAATINAAPLVPATPTVMLTQPTCSIPTGAITVRSPIGTGITYSINGSVYQSGATYSNVASGSYNVTAKNREGCVSPSVAVTINAAPSSPAIPTVTLTQPTCNTPVGTITVNSPVGGGITYSIDGYVYQAGTTFSNVSPGSYNVRAKNSSGCVSSFSVTINAVPAGPATPTVTLTQPTCNTPAGTITVNAPGGSGIIYSINGSTYQVSNFFSNLPQGNYNVTARNSSNCTSAALPVTINAQPALPVTPIITASGSTSLCPGGSVTLSALTSNAWTQKADFGGMARRWATGFSIGNKGYIGTGTDGSYKKDFWEYNPATGAWTQKADFGGVARYGATGFSIGSKGYIGTGTDGTFSYKKDFWEYDPASNAWTQKADFGGTARELATGFSIGGKGYIGTGTDGGIKKDFWEYNPASNAWTQKADFGGTATYRATGFSIGTKGYIGTGNSRKEFWEYDPASNVWTQKADFVGTGRNSATGFSIGTKGYIGTGYYGNPKTDFWEYDPTSNVWTQKADFGGTARDAAIGFSIGNKGYIGTGHDGSSPKKDFWEYDPGYGYSWRPGGQTTASITVSTGGNYTVTTTNALGCSATSAATVVTVNAAPATPTVTVIQPTCSVTTGKITVNSPVGAGITYSINGSVYQSGTTFSNVTPGSYNVTAKNSSGCVSAATTTVLNSCTPAPVIARAISTQQPQAVLQEVSKLSVYPNPSSGTFNVLLSHFSSPGLSLEITDGNGKVVALKALTLTSKTPVLTVPFDLGSKASGMYWVRVVSAIGVQTAKLLIQR